MKQFLIILLLLSSFLMACTKNDDPNDLNNISNDKESAPKNIIGKTFILYNNKSKIVLQSSNFKEKTCDIPNLTNMIFTTFPTYTYVKNGSNNADLCVKYTFKYSFDKALNQQTYTVELNFTSSSEGTYTGIEELVTSGSSYTNLNGTTNRSIYGFFTAN